MVFVFLGVIINFFNFLFNTIQVICYFVKLDQSISLTSTCALRLPIRSNIKTVIWETGGGAVSDKTENSDSKNKSCDFWQQLSLPAPAAGVQLEVPKPFSHPSHQDIPFPFN